MNPRNPQSLTERVLVSVQNRITPVDAVHLAGQLGYDVLDFMERYTGRVAWSIDDLDRLATATGQHVDRFLYPLPSADSDITAAVTGAADPGAAELERMLILREVIEDLNYATLKVTDLLLSDAPDGSAITG